MPPGRSRSALGLAVLSTTTVDWSQRMLNRIERHDIINAMALSLVLLLCGYAMNRWVDSLSTAWDEGFWQAEKDESGILPTGDEARSAAKIRGQHLPNEVSVLVGNGSDGIDGLAGRGASRLGDAGYGTLQPQNVDGEPVEVTTVYYTDGFKPDAEAIAILLGFDEDHVEVLRDSPGVPVEGADVIVVFGNDAAG